MNTTLIIMIPSGLGAHLFNTTHLLIFQKCSTLHNYLDATTIRDMRVSTLKWRFGGTLNCLKRVHLRSFFFTILALPIRRIKHYTFIKLGNFPKKPLVKTQFFTNPYTFIRTTSALYV